MSWENYTSDVSTAVVDIKSKLNSVFSNALAINETTSDDYSVGAYSIDAFDQIISHSNALITYINTFNETITNRGIDIVLLSEQADTFVCNAIDAFDRLIDIRSYCIDDSLMSELLKDITNIRSNYITKFKYFTSVENQSKHISFNDDESPTVVNLALHDMFNDLNKLITKIDEYATLIGLSNTSLDIFSKILRVNTTVGTALSVSSKSWAIAIKLNKNNYKSTIITSDQTILTDKKVFEVYPIENFPEYPKYIKYDTMYKYIDELDFLNISSNIKINLNANEYLETIVTTAELTDITDPGFKLNLPNSSELNQNINKFNSMFDAETFLKIIKNSFVINNFDEINSKLSLSGECIHDSNVLDTFLKLGYNVKNSLISNLKTFLTTKNDHNTINRFFNYKYSELTPYPDYKTISLKYEQYIPIGLLDYNWLYSVALENNKSDAVKIRDLIENVNSATYDDVLGTKLNDYISNVFLQIFNYSTKFENKIISLYHRKVNGNTTLLKRYEINWNIVSNILENSGGLINLINPLTRHTDYLFKYKTDVTCYLADKYLNIDDPLNTETRDFVYYGKYDLADNRRLTWFSLNEYKKITNGYEGILDIYDSSITSARDNDKVFITGSVSTQHVETSFITDNPVVRIATNVANTYRELLIDGKIGYNDARFKAIQFTLLYLGYRRAFDTIIDRSWDLNIPRYLLD